MHLFYDCLVAKRIWNQLKSTLSNNNNFPISTPQSAIFGTYSLTVAMGTSARDVVGVLFFLGEGWWYQQNFINCKWIVNEAMWPKFSKASTFMRELIITSVLQVWPEKPLFWQDSLGSSSIKLGLSLGIALKFHTNVARGLKLKVRKFWRLIPTFVEVVGEKMAGSFSSPTPILNRVN